MRKATRGDISEARLLTPEQAQFYTGMGRTMCRSWCEEVGAVRKFGSLVRFDKAVIDEALDRMRGQATV